MSVEELLRPRPAQGGSTLEPGRLAGALYTRAQLERLYALGNHAARVKRFVAKHPAQAARMQETALVESTESSTRIEGIHVAPGRAAQIVLDHGEPQSKAEAEVAGYRDALKLVHESAEHMPFKAEVTLQLHGMLYRHLPQDGGAWKKSNNEIVETLPGGEKRVRFTPTAPHLTPMAMANLCTSYKAAADAHVASPVILVPLAILDFLCIHPFDDGNGRTSRLLTLQLLCQSGFTIGRYVSLERIVETSGARYYEALAASSERWHECRNDTRPWLAYFEMMLTAAYREFDALVA